MESRLLKALCIVVVSLGVVAVVQAEDKKPAPAPLKFIGRVRAEASAGLSARIAGVVDKVHVNAGDRVKKGQVLIELSAPELKDDLEAAAARLDQAKAEVDKAQALVEEAKARAKPAGSARELGAAEIAHAKAGVVVAQTGVALAQVEMKRAQTRLGFTQLVAPFDGVVARRTVDVGTTVGPPKQGESAPLLTVMRDDKVDVVFDVDEASAPHIAVGATAVVSVPSLRNAVFNGKLTRKGAAFNPETNTLRAEVVLPNADGRLRPGMFVTVDVTQDEAAK